MGSGYTALKKKLCIGTGYWCEGTVNLERDAVKIT